MNEIALIAQTLGNHSVIILPGLSVTRAKCYCGWVDRGPVPSKIKTNANRHQAQEIYKALHPEPVTAELVEE